MHDDPITTVRRFNTEVITGGSAAAAAELLAPDFVNYTAPPGMSPGPDGMIHMLLGLLRPAFPDLRVEIHDIFADGPRVVTRKTLHGTHRGPLFDIAPTGRPVAIDVIDIVVVTNGRYTEHWGLNTLPSLLDSLRT